MALSGDGYNPIYKTCDATHCYINDRHPRMEIFCDCFPGNISFGNFDFAVLGVDPAFGVERCGHLLVVEHKPIAGPINRGQWLMGQNMSWVPDGLLPRIWWVFIAADPKTMICTHMAEFWRGRWHPWEVTTTDQVKKRFRSWVRYTQANRCVCDTAEGYPPKRWFA